MFLWHNHRRDQPTHGYFFEQHEDHCKSDSRHLDGWLVIWPSLTSICNMTWGSCNGLMLQRMQASPELPEDGGANFPIVLLLESVLRCQSFSYIESRAWLSCGWWANQFQFSRFLLFFQRHCFCKGLQLVDHPSCSCRQFKFHLLAPWQLLEHQSWLLYYLSKSGVISVFEPACIWSPL